jgi:methyl-accepting chemotaxis protein
MLKLANPTLATARKNHLDWRERIKDYFLGLTDKDPDFVDHTQCLLGKWIYSSSEVEIKSLGTFVELEAHHKVMHETVPAIVEAKKSRNPKVFESEFRRFHTLADLVVSKIEMLDLEIQKIEFRKSLELARRFQLSLNHYDST